MRGVSQEIIPSTFVFRSENRMGQLSMIGKISTEWPVASPKHQIKTYKPQKSKLMPDVLTDAMFEEWTKKKKAARKTANTNRQEKIKDVSMNSAWKSSPSSGSFIGRFLPKRKISPVKPEGLSEEEKKTLAKLFAVVPYFCGVAGTNLICWFIWELTFKGFLVNTAIFSAVYILILAFFSGDENENPFDE